MLTMRQWLSTVRKMILQSPLVILGATSLDSPPVCDQQWWEEALLAFWRAAPFIPFSARCRHADSLDKAMQLFDFYRGGPKKFDV